jgi:hypothetical protein
VNKKLAPGDIEDIKLARVIEPLRRSEAWRVYSELLKVHKEQHLKNVMTGTVDVAGVLKGERDKGAVVGIDLCLNLLETICTQAESLTKGHDDDASD